jgi:uncharacterized OB-fold protein
VILVPSPDICRIEEGYMAWKEAGVAKNWRMQGKRYRMEGTTCANCGRPIVTDRSICPECSQSESVDLTEPSAEVDVRHFNIMSVIMAMVMDK